MVKTVFEDGFDLSRFIISTVVKKIGDRYECSGRVVQGRGKLQEGGEVEWDDRVISNKAIGENPSRLESLILETLFQYLAEQEFYLFEERIDDSKNDIQEV